MIAPVEVECRAGVNRLFLRLRALGLVQGDRFPKELEAVVGRVARVLVGLDEQLDAHAETVRALVGVARDDVLECVPGELDVPDVVHEVGHRLQLAVVAGLGACAAHVLTLKTKSVCFIVRNGRTVSNSTPSPVLTLLEGLLVGPDHRVLRG